MFIRITERAYKYIREFTIKSVNDAMVELITNCVDAYNKSSLISKERHIKIDVFDQNKINVSDRALGLTSEELESCFLQIGNFTSSETSRGFFSRGAKDITALGNVTFNSIKNNKYSQCVLNTDAYGHSTISNVDVTSEIRNRFDIPEGSNGLCVTLELLPNFQSTDINNLYTSLCNLAVLRDINTDPRNIITLRKIVSEKVIFEKRIVYNYISGELLLDLEYNIPGYPNESAHFVVYKTAKPIPQPSEETMLEFGFLIKDDTAVYEVNTIDNRFRWNPYINYLYGYVKTNAIRKYLLDYDINGSSEKNPYPIIDPSRVSGINKMHPLVKSIYSILLVRIDAILRELNNSISAKTVTIEDVNDLLDELSKYGLDIIQTNDVKVNFMPSYDNKLAKAIQDQRAKYVTYENSSIMAGNYKTEENELENYLKDQIIKRASHQNNYYYLDKDKNLVEIQNKSNGVPNEPINVLDLLSSNDLSQLQNNPYIYKLSETGNKLDKLYIFQKGTIDTNVTTQDSEIIIKNRQFSIQFINDLNICTRYVIDNTNGIIIKLNLNNPMVSKYLTNKNIDLFNDPDNLVSVEVLSSTHSLLFLEHLITDILADLIMQSDVNNKKIRLDLDDSSNSKKILDYRNNLITKIELPVNNIFKKYIDKLIDKKRSTIDTKISSVHDVIINKLSEPTSISADQLELLHSSLKYLINTVIE